MLMNIFINNAIHSGILNYLAAQENKEIDKVHIFEYWVVKVLVTIYGEVNIINPFNHGDADGFKNNLCSYGLKENEANNFINYLSEYDKWLNNPNLVGKTDIPTKIETLLISMVILKNSNQTLDDEDIKFFDGFFDPVEGDMARLNDLIILDKTTIPKLWRRKKVQFEGGFLLKTIEIDLLPASDYKRYGLSIDEVKQLDDLKIKEINDKISAEDAANEATSGGRDKFDPRKLILTSGSGFADTIVLLSIIATEIMIALLIAFTFLRR